ITSGINPRNYRSYKRTYEYDLGGNLCKMQHTTSVDVDYNVEMVVSDCSNKAVKSTNGVTSTPDTVEDYFDLAGNQKTLEGKTIKWNSINRIEFCVVVDRGGEPINDYEYYVYDDSGNRTRKRTYSLTSTEPELLKVSDVNYIGALEIRRTFTGVPLADKNEEAYFNDLSHVSSYLIVINTDSIRVHHWVKGGPSNTKKSRKASKTKKNRKD
ncbi:MAG: hypothetical protein V3T17_03315, partial [Pseudomonadales bacterium]